MSGRVDNCLLGPRLTVREHFRSLMELDAGSHLHGSSLRKVYLNELDANEGGSILHGELPEPTGVMCMNTIAGGGPEELAKECPDEVRVTILVSRAGRGGRRGIFSRDNPSCGLLMLSRPLSRTCVPGDVLIQVATEDSDEADIQTRSRDESTPVSRSHVEVEDTWHYFCSEVPLTPGDVSSSEASRETAGNSPYVSVVRRLG